MQTEAILAGIFKMNFDERLEIETNPQTNLGPLPLYHDYSRCYLKQVRY